MLNKHFITTLILLIYITHTYFTFDCDYIPRWPILEGWFLGLTPDIQKFHSFPIIHRILLPPPRQTMREYNVKLPTMTCARSDLIG